MEEGLPDAAHNRFAIRLELCNLRAAHVRLLAMLEMRSTRANFFFALDNKAGKFIADFLREEFQDGQPEEQVILDIFLELGASDSRLQQIGEQFAELRRIRIARLTRFPRFSSEKLL